MPAPSPARSPSPVGREGVAPSAAPDRPLPSAVPDSLRPSVSVLGLGQMGLPIARNLLAAGLSTTVYNRTRATAEPLAADGARIAGTVAEASADVVLSVLPDVAPLRTLLDDAALAAMGARGSLVVVMSTTGPQEVRSLAEDLAPHGIAVLDAPMSGGVAGAAAGTLSLMLGGEAADVQRARPVLEVLGGTLTHLGPVGAGSLTKLCNQIVVAGTLTSLAEAFGLARAGGIDPTQLAQVLEGGLAASEVLAQKREKLLSRDYSLGGSTDNQVKDLVYATTALEQSAVPARLTPVLLEAFEDLVAAGHGQLDHTVVQELFETRDC